MSGGWSAGLGNLFNFGSSSTTPVEKDKQNDLSFSLFENIFTPGLPIPGLTKHEDETIHNNILKSSTTTDLPSSLASSRIAQIGTDLAWKTILASVVDVEGVGDVGVARVLHEIWKRGGGDAVTNQCLWPSIIMSLSLNPVNGHFTSQADVRIPTPSAQASLALQQLYNLTMRQWEPAIFSGLLAQYASSTSPTPNPFSNNIAFTQQNNANGTTPFGPSTPTKELDLGQWMNMTPSADWSAFLGGTTSLGNATPEKSEVRAGAAAPIIHGPSSLANVFDPREELVGDQRRGSSLIDGDEGSRGIDELLAQMEEQESKREFSQNAAESSQAAMSALEVTPVHTPVIVSTNKKGKQRQNSNSTFFMPTPETEGSETPALPDARPAASGLTSGVSHTLTQSRKGSVQLTPPDDQAASPYVTAGSVHSQASSSTSSTVSRVIPTASNANVTTLNPSTRAQHPTMLPMPTASFIPPPPMCMFFNPSFKDLTTGKLGVWKGDLEVKGRGGGRFAVLVIGEAGTEYLWQSHLWPSLISYPPQGQPTPETCTSTMVPVSHLARDGFTPVSMGMVLCNDPDVGPFCAMVQGLHAEGVAFHLPTPSRLPIVILPAKFDSADNLQRLGIAYMSKPGVLPPPPAPNAQTGTKAVKVLDSKVSASPTPLDKNKKRRRQSAPAKAQGLSGAASRANCGEGVASGAVRKKRMSVGLGKVDETEEKD